MKKIGVLIAMIMLLFTMGACGSVETGQQDLPEDTAEAAQAEAAEDEPDETEATGTQEGQNPVMNFVGQYASDRAVIMIEAADAQQGVSATVSWSSSANESTQWVMSGTFDEETLVFSYSDCVKTNTVYTESGEVESGEVDYTEGSGSMSFHEDGERTLLWQDDQENAGEGMTFTYVSAL